MILWDNLNTETHGTNYLRFSFNWILRACAGRACAYLLIPVAAAHSYLHLPWAINLVPKEAGGCQIHKPGKAHSTAVLLNICVFFFVKPPSGEWIKNCWVCVGFFPLYNDFFYINLILKKENICHYVRNNLTSNSPARDRLFGSIALFSANIHIHSLLLSFLSQSFFIEITPETVQIFGSENSLQSLDTQTSPGDLVVGDPEKAQDLISFFSSVFAVGLPSASQSCVPCGWVWRQILLMAGED